MHSNNAGIAEHAMEGIHGLYLQTNDTSKPSQTKHLML